ncbi:MAG: dihydroorotate dehydrogenase electron transfer subunit [Gammaproteobacteria bacterium]
MTESGSPTLDAARPHRATIDLADGEVVSVERHAGDQVVMRIACPAVAARARPGSFVHLRCAPELAMRRPMSIMRASPGAGWFDMLFKVHGHGSALLAARHPGEAISVLGPIGRPFRLAGYRHRPLLIGGGVGIPPMIFLAEHLRAVAREVEPLVLMGSEVPFPFPARPSRILVPGLDPATIAAMPLLDDWGVASRLASTQGYPGCFDGFVTELARAWIANSGTPREDIEIFACGPTPMLRAVQALAAEFDLPCEISLEEFMACAVGGCAGCVVKVETDAGPAMKRVCVDGPVFDAARVVFDG